VAASLFSNWKWQMRKRNPFFLVMGAIVLAVSASPAGSRAVEVALDDSQCVQCLEDCPVGWHLAANAGTYTLPVEWYRNGGAHLDGLCRSGTCQTMDGPSDCKEPDNFAAVDLKALDQAVASRNPAELRRLVGFHSRYPAFNSERGAIQLSNCIGQIIAHMPVDSGPLVAAAE
jgi:hypothetical protein